MRLGCGHGLAAALVGVTDPLPAPVDAGLSLGVSLGGLAAAALCSDCTGRGQRLLCSALCQGLLPWL